jgi:2-dehydro-3-deoxyphosphooctonate aldolase (KDO 8-P synthase)
MIPDLSSLFIIAGPCVMEDMNHPIKMATALKEIAEEVGLPLIFKSSFSKDNRTSSESFRGLGPMRGLNILHEIRETLTLSVLTDIHETYQAKLAEGIVDIIQIPAFLSRQTSLLEAAAETSLIVNIKKGSFLSPYDMKNVVKKMEAKGCNKLWLTERGFQFGYNNLVVDMRSIPIMQKYGYPVIFDATHSVQLPGGNKTTSGGTPEFTGILAKAAIAAGCNGLFFEVHDDPAKAKSDSAIQFPLNQFKDLLVSLKELYNAITG